MADKKDPKPEAIKAEVVPLDFNSLLKRVNDTTENDVQDSEEIQERLFQQMLAAESIDELLRPATAIHAKDILGQSFMANDVRFNESDQVDGPGVYAIIDATLGDKNVVISCGGRTVMHQLLVMKHREWLPAALKITKAAKPTKAGFYPLQLEAGQFDDEPF